MASRLISVGLTLVYACSLALGRVAVQRDYSKGFLLDYNEQYMRFGYRLVWLDSYVIRGRAKYAAIWDQAPGPNWTFTLDAGEDELQIAIADLRGKGYRPVQLTSHSLHNRTSHSVIWEQDDKTSEWELYPRLSKAQLDMFFGNGNPYKREIRDISGYGRAEGSETMFSAIVDVHEDAPQNFILIDIPLAKFTPIYNAVENLGKRLVSLKAYNAPNGTVLLATIWKRFETGWDTAVSVSLREKSYLAEKWLMEDAGMDIQGLSGYDADGRNGYAVFWTLFHGALPPPTLHVGTQSLEPQDLATIQSLAASVMETCEAPGLSLAVSKAGTVVFTATLGWDRLRQPRARLGSERLFRIGAISQLLTGLGILKLVEEGRIGLSQPLFGLVGTLYYLDPYWTDFTQSNLHLIKVRHLLEHTSNAWPNDRFNPMLNHTNLDQVSWAKTILRNYKQVGPPGRKFIHSDFGYHILGMLIEQVTGTDYAEYIQSAILEPNGIYSAILLNNQAQRTVAMEVEYEKTTLFPFDPYSKLPRLGAANGWLMSMPDLLRLLALLDSRAPDLLSPHYTSLLTNVPVRALNAWGRVYSPRFWHMRGQLPGSYAQVNRWGDLSVSVGLNAACQPHTVDTLVNGLLSSIQYWPNATVATESGSPLLN